MRALDIVMYLACGCGVVALVGKGEWWASVWPALVAWHHWMLERTRAQCLLAMQKHNDALRDHARTLEDDAVILASLADAQRPRPRLLDEGSAN